MQFFCENLGFNPKSPMKTGNNTISIFFFLLPRWADSNKYILILRHKFLPLETSLASRTGLVFR